MNLIIAVCSFALIRYCFGFVEKKSNKWTWKDIFFACQMFFYAWILQPQTHLLFWVGWLAIFYCVYDDIQTESFYPTISVGATLFFMIVSPNPSSLLISFLSFSFFWCITKWKKTKNQLGEADPYLILALTYFSGNLYDILYSFMIATWSGWLVYLFTQKRMTHTPFASFLVFGFVSMEKVELLPSIFFLFLLLTFLFSTIYMIQRIRKKN